MTTVVSMTLPAGKWAVWTRVKLTEENPSSNTATSGDAGCDLFVDLGGGAFPATDRKIILPNEPLPDVPRSITEFTSLQAKAGGSDVTLQCFSQFVGPKVGYAEIMAITLGGISSP
jgi:hypothetical protein